MARYCIDIDGTLTVAQRKNAEPRLEYIEMVKKLCADPKHSVIIWSGSDRYARRWCKTYGIEPMLAIGKPNYIVDNQHLLGRKRKFMSPEEWFEMESAKDE